MKFTRYLLLLFTILAVSLSFQAQAQEEDDDDDDDAIEEGGCEWNCPDGEENGWCWGKNPDMSKEKNVLYNDMMNMNEYEKALPALEWLLENTPNLNKAIYINGEKIYRSLQKSSEGETKIMYQDKVLALLDQRMEYFCEKKKILQKKGQLSYKYLYPRRKENKAIYDTLYQLYTNIYQVAGNETKRSNMTYYMLMVNVMYQLKKVDDNKVLEIFDSLSDDIDFNIEKNKGNKKHSKWVKTKDAIDALFEKTLGDSINCEFVKERWAERITKDNDLKLAKKALRFMIKDKCTSDPLFLQVVEIIHTNAPEVGTAVILYKKYLAADDLTSAYKYMEEATGLAKEDPSKQAEILVDMANTKSKEGKKSDARTDYLKAVELDASIASDVYSKIGNMYYASFKSCLADGGDPIKDKTPYFAAYDMYARAGDSAGMARAKAQFPTKSDIFIQAGKGYTEGGSISVGCWIGGSTTIRAR